MQNNIVKKYIVKSNFCWHGKQFSLYWMLCRSGETGRRTGLKNPAGLPPHVGSIRPPAPLFSFLLSPIPQSWQWQMTKSDRTTQPRVFWFNDNLLSISGISKESQGRAELATKLARTSCKKILDKSLLLWFIALTLNQLVAPYIFYIPPTKPHPKRRYTGLFIQVNSLLLFFDRLIAPRPLGKKPLI